VGYRNSLTVHKEPKKVWEIDTHAPGKGMPTPDSRIHVKNLEFAVAGVLLELDLHKARKME
jgi:hypothetical protein